MYTLHTQCRACGYAPVGPSGTKSPTNEKLIEVLDFGVQPLANAFLKPDQEQPGFAPLKVLYCPRCTLAQLSVVVDPTILYSTYNYVTSTSDTMLNHFAALWNDIRNEAPVKGIVEIGSNTGNFLAYCLRNGAERAIGIDPAENLCDIALAQNHIVTITDMLTPESAEQANRKVFIDCVVARHVFCHAANWKSFIRDLRSLGHDETIYCIEVPYAADTIKMNSWDQIYHEHLSYLTLRAMKAVLVGSGLHIHNVQRYPVHGGAIVITLRRDESLAIPSPEICAEVGRENVTAEDWRALAARATEQQQKLKATLDVAIAQGKRVSGLGASAKSTVWVNACHLTRKHISFIADNTTQKWYTFSPGSDIPIVDEGAIMRELPDYVVMWCWNYERECIEKNRRFLELGGKFIVPVPEIHIVTKHGTIKEQPCERYCVTQKDR